MPSVRTLLALLLIGAALACGADPMAPSPAALAGQWRLGPVPLSPSGQFVRTLEFTAGGQYVMTVASRGTYPTLPADSVASITWEYGSYVLHADTLRFAQDSVRSWDYLSGAYFHAGPRGIDIEGPPTDPIIEVTSTRLTLRYMVNPGGGYEPVTAVYLRDSPSTSSESCDPENAPSQVHLGASGLRLTANAWLNLMPGPGLFGDTLSNGETPFRAFIVVWGVPGGPLPTGLDADSVWITDRTHRWSAPLTSEDAQSTDTTFVRRVWGGPRWLALADSVDVTARVRLGSESRCIRAPRVYVQHTS